MNIFSSDTQWMQLALQLAKQALEKDEVPVGAVLVKNNTVLASAGNASIAHCDPTAHAEILVLREAALKLQTPKLHETTLYVTLEPCPMCLGAIIQAQVQRVVFGAYDTQAGAAGTAFNLLQSPTVIWRPEILGGVNGESSYDLLRSFFKKRRG